MSKFNEKNMISAEQLESMSKNDPWRAEEIRKEQISILKNRLAVLDKVLYSKIELICKINENIKNIKNDIDILEMYNFDEIKNIQKLGFILND